LKTAFDFTAINCLESLAPLHEVRVARSDDYLVIESLGKDPYLQTAPVDLAAEGHYWISLKMVFPRSGFLQISFERKDIVYTEADSKRFRVPKGEAGGFINIPNPETVSRLRLDPGDEPGEYILKEFTIIKTDSATFPDAEGRLNSSNWREQWLTADNLWLSDSGEFNFQVFPKDRKNVLLVTHVVPYPPRAGNEYRIYRMICWMDSQGYRVVLVVSPMPGVEISKDTIAQLSDGIRNFIICYRDGTCVFDLDGKIGSVRLKKGLLHKIANKEGCGYKGDRKQFLGKIEIGFCPSSLMRLVRKLVVDTSDLVILTNYIWLTRFLPLYKKRLLTIIDTHDVFSTKESKVGSFGISDPLAVNLSEERRLLLRGDVIIAIQPEERLELAKIVPERKVITCGVDFGEEKSNRLGRTCLQRSPSILCVASDNPLNVRGVQDFIDIAWPLVRRDFPDLKLIICGLVCLRVKSHDDRIVMLGALPSLTELYQEAAVAVNPNVAGTGLKIKTLEAMYHGTPVVTWPAGLDGLPVSLKQMCLCCRDFFEFYEHIGILLKRFPEPWFSDDDMRLIRRLLSPSIVYEELGSVLQSRLT
jgi:glycosyltransferase involved in cell wall biosynthesis